MFYNVQTCVCGREGSRRDEEYTVGSSRRKEGGKERLAEYLRSSVRESERKLRRGGDSWAVRAASAVKLINRAGPFKMPSSGPVQSSIAFLESEPMMGERAIIVQMSSQQSYL